MSRCRDGFCGADDCDRCYPREREERDPDEAYDAARQEKLDKELDDQRRDDGSRTGQG